MCSLWQETRSYRRISQERGISQRRSPGALIGKEDDLTTEIDGRRHSSKQERKTVIVFMVISVTTKSMAATPS